MLDKINGWTAYLTGARMGGIELTRRGDLAEITLNRPGRRNALAAEDWAALREAAEQVAQGPARAVILRGAGGDFSAGFDISGLRPDGAHARAIIEDLVNPALRALRAIPVPALAAVEGACVGGGLGVAAACDMIIASETARFGAPYARIGIMADAGLHVFLREAIGPQQAARLILTGALVPAREALAMGLCAEVAPADAFEARAAAIAAGLAAGPTVALSHSKRLLRSGPDPDAALDAEAAAQAEVFATLDAAEGVAAFLAGRKPVFRGR